MTGEHLHGVILVHIASMESVMPRYRHYYYCPCVTRGRIISNFNNDKDLVCLESAEPELQRGINHWQADGTRRCQRYLRPVRVEQIPDQVPIDPASPALGLSLLLDYARRSSAPTVAAMYDPQTANWYLGKCRHYISENQGAGRAWFVDAVGRQQVDRSDWGFGWNCAEVECVIKALNGGRAATDLRGCYFIACSTSRLRVYGACRTCRGWIGQLGAQFHPANP